MDRRCCEIERLFHRRGQLLYRRSLLNDAGHLVGGQVGQLLRLHLVKPAAIDPTFFDEMLAGQCLKVSENHRVQLGTGFQGRFHLALGV